MSKTKFIKFTQDHTLADGSASFEEGKVYELNPASAGHHIKRGWAVEVPADEVKREEPPVVEGNAATDEGSEAVGSPRLARQGRGNRRKRPQS